MPLVRVKSPVKIQFEFVVTKLASLVLPIVTELKAAVPQLNGRLPVPTILSTIPFGKRLLLLSMPPAIRVVKLSGSVPLVKVASPCIVRVVMLFEREPPLKVKSFANVNVVPVIFKLDPVFAV